MIKEQPSQEETRRREPGSILDRSAIRRNDPQQHARQRRAHGETTTTMCSTATSTLVASCGRTRLRQIADGSGPSRRGCRKAHMTVAMP